MKNKMKNESKVEYDYTVFEDLTSGEILSILKSNKLTPELEQNLHGIATKKIVKELITKIMCVAVAQMIIKVIDDSIKEQILEKNKKVTEPKKVKPKKCKTKTCQTS
jgi:hypothetical protein